jgi:peptidoglycan/LPS O-acetylase OafA/YrhL
MISQVFGPKRSDRMRAIGWVVLAAGLAGAVVCYWIQAQTFDPALTDMTALGYTKSLQHGMGVMMGPFGLMLTEWQEALMTPIGEALMVAVAAALVAGYFFRVAWVLDAEEREQ